MIPEAYDAIEMMLGQLLENKLVDATDLQEGIRGIQERILKLQTLHRELQQYAVKLSFGDVDAIPPPRSNYLAAGLKQLQSQMAHLTWQAQRVAQGDYSQQIDFMGDFSKAFNDMTSQLQQREARLREQQDAMVNIFDKIEPILVVDENDRSHILYANSHAYSLFDIQAGSPAVQTALLNRILDIPIDNEEHQLEDSEARKWYSISTYKLQWSNHPSAQLFYCRDITAHKEREIDLHHVANTDKLTGICNRRAMEQSLAIVWDACLKAHKPLSLIMFDIDEFKVFNDTYGHMEGDKALVFFADVLNHSVRRTDDVIARYGGEEFIVLLPFTSQENAMRIAESVRRLTEKDKVLITKADKQEAQVGITVSGGVSSVVPAKCYLPSQLILAADSALYVAKQQGRNRISYQDIDAAP